MNAEALIGMVLGNCTLQKLIGQGGMGAVFLAQQARPRRQVAVKVLLPMTPLGPNQLAAFLERFQRETDAVASLEHPNIMPVHGYDEQNGLAFLIMPYISGGTLRDELEREGQLPLEKVMNYLDQMSAAIDIAHEHGIVHRDIKPANIMKTARGRLLLTDFGLVKVIAEGNEAQVRLTGVGAPVGTPDYMAPEQVMGTDVDPRADLYSLGVILYQMVTGSTPFHGETPIQVATQHLQVPPPSPHMLRRDLPIAAEQVILRALAKRPADRYMHAQELADAFRTALIGAGIPLSANAQLSIYTSARMPNMYTSSSMPNMPAIGMTTGRIFTPGGLLDPARQTRSLPIPATKATPPSPAKGLLSRTGKFPQVGADMRLAPASAAMVENIATTPPLIDRSRPPIAPQIVGMSPTTDQTPSLMRPVITQNQVRGSKAVKNLARPVKVMQVPVAGQPGTYVSGILPMAPRGQKSHKGIRLWMKIAILTVLVLLITGVLAATLVLFPTRLGNRPPTTNNGESNVLFTDPLNQPSNAWPVAPPNVYAFKDGAYHVTIPNDAMRGEAPMLPEKVFTEPMVYSLTIQEIDGNDAPNNLFGMIFLFNQKTIGNTTATTFYTFEVDNSQGGTYQFDKYDDTKLPQDRWSTLWTQQIGNEFHEGHGAQAINTLKVSMNGNAISFIVNGMILKQIPLVGAATSGQIGMIINQAGTEVAFKDLQITRK